MKNIDEIMFEVDLDKILSSFTCRDIQIFKMKYGIEQHSEMSFQEIATAFNLSGARIQQIIKKCNAVIRHPKHKKIIKAYIGKIFDQWQEEGFTMKNLMTKKEVCKMLSISIPTLNRFMIEGEIKFIKFNRAVRFKEEDVDSFINSCVKNS